jgi:hypothetical protein
MRRHATSPSSKSITAPGRGSMPEIYPRDHVLAQWAYSELNLIHRCIFGDPMLRHSGALAFAS